MTGLPRLAPPLLAPALLAAALLASAAPARADTHTVTIRNAGGDTISTIHFNGAGDSRLRRPLPPGAEARITYSTGCRADIHVTYASGRSEDFPSVDVCSDPRIEAGSGNPGAPSTAATQVGRPSPAPGKGATAAATTSTQPVKAPPPEVPAWTGKSITKRFGGLD